MQLLALSVCLCLCTKLLDSDCEDDNEDLCFTTTGKPGETFYFLLISDMNEGYLTLQMYLNCLSPGRYAVGYSELNQLHRGVGKRE
jgi:hypothetical protein